MEGKIEMLRSSNCFERDLHNLYKKKIFEKIIFAFLKWLLFISEEIRITLTQNFVTAHVQSESLTSHSHSSSLDVPRTFLLSIHLSSAKKCCTDSLQEFCNYSCFLL